MRARTKGWPRLGRRCGRIILGCLLVTSLFDTALASDRMSNAIPAVAAIQDGTTFLGSIPPGGGQFKFDTWEPDLSTNGRHIAFASWPGTFSIGGGQVFVRDLQARSTRKVSTSSSGEWGNGTSSMPSVSGDGRFVAFASRASNLGPRDENDATDVYVRDMATGAMEIVSKPDVGASNGESGNTDCTGFNCVEGLDISSDGRYVTYASGASNLVSGDSNGRIDVFVYDRTTAQTSRVSVSSSGEQGDYHSGIPSISDDGQRIVFTSSAITLAPMPDDMIGHGFNVFLHEVATGETELISYRPEDDYSLNWGGNDATISGDGRFIAFSSDVDYTQDEEPGYDNDVFVYEIATEHFERVSIGESGAEAEDGTSNWEPPVLSQDGRFVAFGAYGPLVSNDSNDEEDVFLHDRATAVTSRVSVGTDGSQATQGVSGKFSISGDGQSVAFDSWSEGLVAGDKNGLTDVFIRTLAVQQKPLPPPDGIFDYVALGDSFSAGEGVEPWFEKSKCHQSQHAYPTLVRPLGYDDTLLNIAGDPNSDVTWSFLACSGAVTQNVLPEAEGGSPQFDDGYGQELTQLDRGENGDHVDLVTITIGGNDVRFAKILQFCARNACMSGKTFDEGRSLKEWLPVEIDYSRHKLVNTYRAIKEANPNATIVVLSYPMLFPRSDAEQTCFKLSPWKGEQDFLRREQRHLHRVIRSAAAEVGVHYLDVAPNFAGHEICGNKKEWINATGLANPCPPFSDCEVKVDDESFHPKKRGQREYAYVLNEWLKSHGPGLARD